MAKESQRLDNFNFPRVIVDTSPFLSQIRQLKEICNSLTQITSHF